MAELVLIAEFPAREAATSEAQAIVKRLGRSPTVRRSAAGWGLFASLELADRIRQEAAADRAPRAVLVKPSAPVRPASVEASTSPGAARPEPLLEARTTVPSTSRSAPRTRVWSMSGDEARRMAAELRHAYAKLSEADAKEWLRRTLQRFPRAIARRVGNLTGTVVNVVETTGEEIINLVRAIWEQRAVDHLNGRFVEGARKAAELAENVRARTLPLLSELKNDPSSVAPDLFVAALAFYVSGGGFDGDGGIPDTDIPMLGIGAHRSIFTHSIIAGAVVETALHSLLDFVAVGYRHLPSGHDPRWTIMHERLRQGAAAGTKGMSAGLAYHLGVDGLVQPGAYHGLPFEMPMAGHEAILTANAAAEGIDIAHKESGEQRQPDGFTAPAQAPHAAQTDDGRFKNILVGAGALAVVAAEFFS